MTDNDPAELLLELTIRLADIDDLESVHRCVRSADAQRDESPRPAPVPNSIDFQRLIDDSQVLVATQSNEIYGVMRMYDHGNYLHLDNLTVQAEHTGKGLGRHVLKLVEQFAHKSGYAGVELCTNALMIEHLAIYKEWAYSAIARKHQDGHDRVYFRKSFAPT